MVMVKRKCTLFHSTYAALDPYFEAEDHKHADVYNVGSLKELLVWKGKGLINKGSTMSVMG